VGAPNFTSDQEQSLTLRRCGFSNVHSAIWSRLAASSTSAPITTWNRGWTARRLRPLNRGCWMRIRMISADFACGRQLCLAPRCATCATRRARRTPGRRSAVFRGYAVDLVRSLSVPEIYVLESTSVPVHCRHSAKSGGAGRIGYTFHPSGAALPAFQLSVLAGPGSTRRALRVVVPGFPAIVRGVRGLVGGHRKV